MHIYWRIRSLPELTGLPKKEQLRLWRSVVWRVFTLWPAWVVLVLGVSCSVVGQILGAQAAEAMFSGDFWATLIPVTLGMVLGLLSGVGLAVMIGRPLILNMLRPYLRKARESL